jgi:hypothetical protein
MAATMHGKRSKLMIIPLILLASMVAVSFMITEDVFAKQGRYVGDTTSQAAAANNECLNPILDSNTIDNMVDVGNCAGTISQQDESGQAGATTTSQTANPTIELQRATTTQPGPGAPTPETCEECLDVLTDEQKQAFLEALPLDLSRPTIEQFCEFYSTLTLNQREVAAQDIETALITAGVPDFATIHSILLCLQNSVG